MALRGRHQFSFVLTSDGSMSSFPTNKSSSFKVQLEKPLNFDEGEWVVGLEYVNYCYSWTNLGPAAGTIFKFFYNEDIGVKEVHFPNWLCTDMRKLVNFLQGSVNKIIGPDKVFIGLDSLDCLKIKSDSAVFDVGFSLPLMKLLGLIGGENSDELLLDAFEKRVKYRRMLSRIWLYGFDYTDLSMRQALKKALENQSFSDFLSIIVEKVDMEKLRSSDPYMIGSSAFGETQIKDLQEIKHWNAKFSQIYEKALKDVTIVEPGDDIEYETSAWFIRDMMAIWFYLDGAYGSDFYPLSSIKGVTPGSLNPVERMFIYTNLIEPVDFNGGSNRLLRMINTHGEPFKTTHEEFLKVIYLPVQKGQVSVIEVYVTDASGKPVPFQSGTLMLMLHFRRQSSEHSLFRYY